MTKDALYTLEELAQAAQVTPRAVRYYATKGLLPAPQSRGRFALYGTAHLNRLRLIAQLKHALLPLAAMRDRMLSLTDAQVTALLARSDWSPGDSSTKAGDVLAALPPDSVGASLVEQADAYQYLLDALTAREGAEAAPSSESSPSSPPPRRALFPRPYSEEEKRRKGEKEREEGEEGKGQSEEIFSLPNHQPPTTNHQLETWQRIVLAPGVELHIRAPELPETRTKLERLLAEATALFSA